MKSGNVFLPAHLFTLLLQCVPRKGIGSAECDSNTLSIIYIPLYTADPNPFRGKHRSILTMIALQLDNIQLMELIIFSLVAIPKKDTRTFFFPLTAAFNLSLKKGWNINGRTTIIKLVLFAFR